ncbi:bifunctional homocysteine S-methyltransferase/methylenetetrahydrofolate reductase [Terriglobus aquaticus]|uniref:Bifunctional homocysteine S-methyltransferase/methylenetetrahydrofolate reductase n=1 Tax=Terriglobus aquaticus TaxID=940139 RepID=A0ABW9KKV1_9BACT|nr:bifunctional homocysteine S-methyltransferase/methylenetetrahydrofolate reductase [Terriglobus aquaticus]
MSANSNSRETDPFRARLASGKPLLCDGAMGTMFYARGVFINRCYDELNLSEPQLVRDLHEEYLAAGAEVIETNTFGANSVRLKRFDLQSKVAQINTAGVHLARAAADLYREKHAHQALVAGSIGPLGAPAGSLNPDAMQAVYAEQAAALASAGVDLFLIETATSLAEALAAVHAAHASAPNVPVVAMITVTDSGSMADGTTPEQAVAALQDAGVVIVGCNCSDGPNLVLQTLERMRGSTTLPLAAMPNAGVPNCVDGRSIYLSSPEYLGSFARKAARLGALLVGGCCGTTPAHIKAMRSSLRAIQAQAEGLQATSTAPTAPPVEPAPLGQRSRLGARIASGEFVAMVEIVPPRGIDCSKELAGARLLRDMGVHAINVPDSPRASARMSAGSLCVQLERECGGEHGVETVLHFTCRDRNLLGIQSDLLGAASLGLRNVLCLTGDPPKMGSYPDATAVFDVDAVGLTRIARDLNHGLDLGGQPIGQSTGFVLACAANPGVPDLDAEVRRFAAKVEAGAEFAITQPVFDLHQLEDFLRRIESFRIPVVAGIWPLTSVKNALFMRNDLKVHMPDEIIDRMGRCTTPEASREEGVRIAQEMLAVVRDSVQGVQVSAPFGRYELAAKVMANVLSPPNTQEAQLAEHV